MRPLRRVTAATLVSEQNMTPLAQEHHNVMIADTTTVDVLEQGRLVEVRQRRHAVTDVVGSPLSTSLLSDPGKPQHLITLASVEDYALGQGVRVQRDLREISSKPEHGWDCLTS
jgi:hypothetical protein